MRGGFSKSPLSQKKSLRHQALIPKYVRDPVKSASIDSVIEGIREPGFVGIEFFEATGEFVSRIGLNNKNQWLMQGQNSMQILTG